MREGEMVADIMNKDITQNLVMEYATGLRKQTEVF